MISRFILSISIVGLVLFCVAIDLCRAEDDFSPSIVNRSLSLQNEFSDEESTSAANVLEKPMVFRDAEPSLPKRSQDRIASYLLDELTFLLAIDGSKQPQDFGVNANNGYQASFNLGHPLILDRGIGLQVGTGVTSTVNAVRVFELLGESTRRTQSFTTIGLFQRTESGFAWGVVHDFLSEDYFDHFSLGQWRIRGSYRLTASDELGITSNLHSYSDSGLFANTTPVRLSSINQGSVYWRRFWGTKAQTTGWIGIADSHGEDNAVTGFSPPKKDPFLFGADILMPLTSSLAIYGETNMIMPMDTGTVDAFLGLQWYPGRKALRARQGTFSPLMSLASPVSFSTDLSR